MKKSIIVLAVLALVAAPMFADTALSASGEFSAELDVNLDGDDMLTGTDGSGDGVKLGLAATTGEYTTFSAEAVGGFDSALTVNHYTMTQDLAGALMIDGMGLKAEMGLVSLYNTNSSIGAITTFDLSGTTVALAILPTTYASAADDAAEFAVEVGTTVSIVGVTADFGMVGETMGMKLATTYALADGISAYLDVEFTDLSAVPDSLVLDLGVDYSAGPLSAGVDFDMTGVADTMAVAVDASYMIMDDLKGFVEAGIPLTDGDITYAGGLVKTLDTVDYGVKYTSDNMVVLSVGGSF